MKLTTCTLLLLLVVDEFYCNTTSSTKKTSWGYDYSVNDNNEYMVTHDDAGYVLKPLNNNISSRFKKHYDSQSVYDHFTSTEAGGLSEVVGTNGSQSPSSANGLLNGTSIFIRTLTSNGTVRKNGNEAPTTVLSSTLAPKDTTTGFRAVPTANTHKATFSKPTVPNTNEISSLVRAPVNDNSIEPSVPPHGTVNKSTFIPEHDLQNTPTYGILTGPLYYPYYSSYNPIYGDPDGFMHGTPNSPTYWQQYGPQNGQMFVPSTDAVNGYRPQNGQMYGPQNGQMYVPPTGSMGGYRGQNGQMYVPQYWQIYGPQYGQMYVPSTGSVGGYLEQNGPQNGRMYVPQNGQMYMPQNNQMYVPQNGQMNVPPTGSVDADTTQNNQTYALDERR